VARTKTATGEVLHAVLPQTKPLKR
jgi:hypothetical protein